MKCENCIHYDVCTMFESTDFYYPNQNCEHFKNKDLFVEFPFKIGDIAYNIRGIRADTGTRYITRAWITEGNMLYYKRLYEEHNVFLTKDEAKKKLEELKNENR